VNQRLELVTMFCKQQMTKSFEVFEKGQDFVTLLNIVRGIQKEKGMRD
jgi:hypothetical protein